VAVRTAAAGMALALGCLAAAPPVVAAPAVAFLAPTEGSRVTSPLVLVRLSITGLRPVDAGKPVVPGEGHAHLFVDRDPVRPGENIPTDQPNIVHLGKAPFDSRSISLRDGRHTLWAQLADSSHIALGAPATRATFTVVTPRPGVEIVAPAQDAVAAGPAVEVWLAITNLKAVDAGLPVEPGQGHAHLFVDRNPVRPGENIPTDQPNVVHLGKAPYDSRTLTLTEGAHTLWAQLGDSGHVALDLPTPKAAFVVAPGFRGKGTLEPSCAEVATGTSDARLVFPVGGGLVQGSISSRCGFRTEGGACSWISLSYRRVLGSFDARSAALRGDVYSATERRLEAGDPGRCGSGSVVGEPTTSISATLSGNGVSGTLGLARVVVHSDASVVLEPPSLPLSLRSGRRPATARPSAQRTPLAVWVVGAVAAAASVALLLALAVRARRSPAPVPVGAFRPTTGPRCPACGEPRREGARFCFACGHRY
jgi:hypothetical protein